MGWWKKRKLQNAGYELKKVKIQLADLNAYDRKWYWSYNASDIDRHNRRLGSLRSQMQSHAAVLGLPGFVECKDCHSTGIDTFLRLSVEYCKSCEGTGLVHMEDEVCGRCDNIPTDYKLIDGVRYCDGPTECYELQLRPASQ